MAASPVQPKPGEQAKDPLAALQEELKKQGEEVARLRQHAAQQPVVQQVQQPPAGQPPSKEDIEKIFWKDPLPMVDAIARRVAWETEQRVQATGADTQRQVARDKAREADPEVFDKYALEIEKMVGQVAPQFQGNLNVWQNALNMVRGQHVDEIFAAKVEKEKGSQVNGQQQQQVGNDGPARPSARQPAPPKLTPLTDEQKEVARGLHLSEEEYRRGIDRYNNQEKHWPKVVTFSSEERRRANAAVAAAKRNAAK